MAEEPIFSGDICGRKGFREPELLIFSGSDVAQHHKRVLFHDSREVHDDLRYKESYRYIYRVLRKYNL
jgi:hypothetical protein